MKVYYHVYSGSVPVKSKAFVYQFSRTRNISLKISKKGFDLRVYRTVKKTGDQILQDPLFRDALKKAAKIQLIKYGSISNGSIYAEVDGNIYCLYEMPQKEQQSILFCLCGNKLLRTIPTVNWGNNSLQRILTVTKSKTNRLDASLDAVLMAKSKEYETEKFIYLWMAMNGLYGYAAEKAREYEIKRNVKGWIKNEYGQLKFFAMLNNYPYRTVQDDQKEKKLLKKLESVIGRITVEQIEEFVHALQMNDGNDIYVGAIQAILDDSGIEKGKMHPYATLLLYMSYKVRCTYFHAEKTIPLICFENEHPVPILRVLNVVLEDFLDNNLYKWFDDDLLNVEIIPKIEVLIQSCKCNRNNRLEECIINGVDLF